MSLLQLKSFSPSILSSANHHQKNLLPSSSPVLTKFRSHQLSELLHFTSSFLPTSFSPAFYLQFLYKSQHHCLLYTSPSSNEIQGVIAGRVCKDGTRHIWVLAIHPSLRGTGAAAELVYHWERQCSGQLETSTWLEVGESNHSAKRFYEKNGFMETSIKKDYYGCGKHAIVMQKG